MKDLTVKDVAKLLAQNEETIRRKIRDKTIPARLDAISNKSYRISGEELIHLGLVSENDIVRFISKKNENKQAEAIESTSLHEIMTVYEERSDSKKFLDTILKLNEEYERLLIQKKQLNQSLSALDAERKAIMEDIAHIDYKSSLVKQYTDLVNNDKKNI